MSKDSDANYSHEVLQDMLVGRDCRIDDPDLIQVGNEKMLRLGTRTSPLALCNMMIAKWKFGGHNIRLDFSWETKDKGTNRSIWHWRIGILDKGIFGEASDFNK